MTTRKYSQTSRDRLVANMIIVIPVAVLLLVIRIHQSPSASP